MRDADIAHAVPRQYVDSPAFLGEQAARLDLDLPRPGTPAAESTTRDA